MRLVQPADAVAEADKGFVRAVSLNMPQTDAEVGLVRPIRLGERAVQKGFDQLFDRDGEHAEWRGQLLAWFAESSNL